MGTKKEGDGCYAAAMEDEPMFVLLARDPKAPHLVEDWADEREYQIGQGKRPEEDRARVDEARTCARRMRDWRIANEGTWRKIT